LGCSANGCRIAGVHCAKPRWEGRAMNRGFAGMTAGLLLATCFCAATQADDVIEAPPPQSAQSETGAPGRVNSVSYKSMPEGFPILVSTYDNTEINVEILDQMTQALQQRGYLVAEDAPLELAFESQTLGVGVADPAPSLGSISGGTGHITGNEGSAMGVEATINLWSSSKDSVLGGRKQSDLATKPTRFHINATLRYRDTGQVVWQGDALCEVVTRDQSRLVRAMVGPLVDSLGETVEAEPFTVQ